MNAKRNIAKTVGLGLAMIVASGTAAAFDTPYKGTISGSFISSQIDAIPGDGVKAILGSFAVTSRRLGAITSQALTEDVPATTPSGNCPAGTETEFTLGSARANHRFANGDILYLKAMTRTGCLDIDTLTFSVHETGEFAGGTGQFAQATGTWEITGTAKVLVIDPKGEFFGSFDGALDGTIVTPARIRTRGN